MVRIKKFFKLFRPSRKRKVHLSPELQSLSQIIRCNITEPQLFSEALRHRSSLQLSPPCRQLSNERLEFLGDSILNFIVGEYLFQINPTAEEGKLTVLRARYVNRKALAVYAKQIQLQTFMNINPSLVISSEKGMDTIIADGFEALVAAIYLDSGYELAKKFVLGQIQIALEKKSLETSDGNYKSQLLEFSQSHNWGIPTYTTLQEEGPDHDRTFTVEVKINSDTKGIGVGKSKKDAEQNAAEKALQNLQN
mgnify:FL=1